MSIRKLEVFPNRVLIELSRIAFPIIVLSEDDRTDFALEDVEEFFGQGAKVLSGSARAGYPRHYVEGVRQ